MISAIVQKYNLLSFALISFGIFAFMFLFISFWNFKLQSNEDVMQKARLPLED